MSHMGKPKGKVNEKLSLAQIREDVAKALGTDVKFAPDCANAQEAAAALKPERFFFSKTSASILKRKGSPQASTKTTPPMTPLKKN